MWWDCIGASVMPHAALLSSEPAAALGIHPAPTGISRSGLHRLPRDWDPIWSPHGGWQLSTSPPLTLLCSCPSSLHRDGNHCLPWGLGASAWWHWGACSAAVSSASVDWGTSVPTWIMGRECNFIQIYHSGISFFGGWSTANVASDKICQALHPDMF